MKHVTESTCEHCGITIAKVTSEEPYSLAESNCPYCLEHRTKVTSWTVED